MDLINIFLALSFILNTEAVSNDPNVGDYDRMPELSVIDDYDSCMRRSDGVYCLATVALEADPNNRLYKQIWEYSQDYIRHYNHTILDRAVCLPVTCKKHYSSSHNGDKSLDVILGECLNDSIWNRYELTAKLQKVHYCNKHDDVKEINYLHWITVTAVTIIIVMNCVGSFCQNQNPYLRSFSLTQNWNDLWIQKNDESEYSLYRGLAGIRMCSLFFILLSHVIYGVREFGDDVHKFEKLHENNYFYMIVMYGLHAVQISFAISGFLLAYKVSQYEDMGNVVTWRDVPKLLLYRFIRLTPSYIIVLLIAMSWTQLLGSGPLWDWSVGSLTRDCRQYFWHHLFYINNYMSDDMRCILPTWHIAADTQLFTLGVVILFLTKRRILWLSIFIVLGLVGPLVDIWWYGADAVAVITPELLRKFEYDSFRLSHLRGHNNLFCFFPGIITGLLVYKWQKQRLIINKETSKYLLNMVPLGILALFLSNNLLYADGTSPPLFYKMIFAVMFRIGLAALLSLVLVAISLKCHGVVYRSLAWSGWQVPSRLSYCVYLIHHIVIIVHVGTRTTKSNLSLVQFIITYLGILTSSFILAIFLYVLVEAPFRKLLNAATVANIKNVKINNDNGKIQ